MAAKTEVPRQLLLQGNGASSSCEQALVCHAPVGHLLRLPALSGTALVLRASDRDALSQHVLVRTPGPTAISCRRTQGICIVHQGPQGMVYQ